MPYAITAVQPPYGAAVPVTVSLGQVGSFASSAAGLGLSAYQLSKATSSYDKAVGGLQVAGEAIGLVGSATGTGIGLVAAPIQLGLLGIGLSRAASARQKASRVRRKFRESFAEYASPDGYGLPPVLAARAAVGVALAGQRTGPQPALPAELGLGGGAATLDPVTGAGDTLEGLAIKYGSGARSDELRFMRQQRALLELGSRPSPGRGAVPSLLSPRTRRT